MMRDHPGQVENYTKPFLVMACVLLFITMFAMWAIFNFAVSIVTGVIVHRAIDRIPRED